MHLVLSLFPGIGLLDKAFEKAGFCVVRGPDLLFGGDVNSFHPPFGRFEGIIGGPPCQSHTLFAKVNQAAGNQVAADLVPEFLRVVRESGPCWFLMENAIKVPVVAVDGYQVQVLTLDARWFGCEQARRRVFQFGHRDGLRIHPRFAALEHPNKETTCLASECTSGRITTRVINGAKKSVYRPRREFRRFCELQGLPPDFLADSPFTLKGKYRAVGNGVPIPMGFAVAEAIANAIAQTV